VKRFVRPRKQTARIWIWWGRGRVERGRKRRLGGAWRAPLPGGFYIYIIITVALYTNITLIMRLTDVAAFSWISYIFTTLSYVACQVGLKHSYTISRWTRNYLAAPALCFQGTRALLGGSRARSFFPEADQGTRDRRPGSTVCIGQKNIHYFAPFMTYVMANS
jgi:hypothetical protein